MQIDPTLYRALYDEALGIVRSMVPQLAEHALQAKQDPSAAVGDAIDRVFERVLENFERHQIYLEPPDKRKSAPTKRGAAKPAGKQWDPFV